MVFKFSTVFDFRNARKYVSDVGLLLELTLESGICFICTFLYPFLKDGCTHSHTYNLSLTGTHIHTLSLITALVSLIP